MIESERTERTKTVQKALEASTVLSAKVDSLASHLQKSVEELRLKSSAQEKHIDLQAGALREGLVELQQQRNTLFTLKARTLLNSMLPAVLESTEPLESPESTSPRSPQQAHPAVDPFPVASQEFLGQVASEFAALLDSEHEARCTGMAEMGTKFTQELTDMTRRAEHNRAEINAAVEAAADIGRLDQQCLSTEVSGLKARLEGIAKEAFDRIECLERFGVDTEQLRSVPNTTRSEAKRSERALSFAGHFMAAWGGSPGSLELEPNKDELQHLAKDHSGAMPISGGNAAKKIVADAMQPVLHSGSPKEKARAISAAAVAFKSAAVAAAESAAAAVGGHRAQVRARRNSGGCSHDDGFREHCNAGGVAMLVCDSCGYVLAQASADKVVDTVQL